MMKQKMHYGLLLMCLLLHFSSYCIAQRNNADVIFANKQIADAKKNSLKDTVLTKQQLNDALRIAVKLNNDTLFAKAYEVFGVTNARKGNHQQALDFFNKQMAHSKKTGNGFFIAVSLNNISNAQSSLGKNNESIETSLKALKIFEQMKNLPYQAKVLLNTGITYMYMGNYEKATQYELKALAINEAINEKSNIASNAAALGALYARMKNFKNALAYNQKALALFQEMKDELLVANTTFNIATVEVRQRQYQMAEKHLLEILPYFEKINKKESLRKVYVQLINIADETGKEVKAESYLRKALSYSVKTGNPVNDIDVMFNEASLLIFEKKYDLAEQKLIAALQLANEANLYLQKLNAKKHLIMLYQESGQKGKAARAFTGYDLTKDSLLNQDNINNLNELQTKYETEKKETQISLLNKENKVKSLQLINNGLEIERNKNMISQQQQELTINQLEIRNKNQLVKNQQVDAERKNESIKNLQKQAQIQDLKLAKRNMLMITISFIALLSMLIVYLLYNRNKLKQKAILEAEIFKQQEIASQSLFEGEQKERIRIARDLHDSIGQMLSVVKMNISSMDDYEVENSLPKNTANLVDKTIAEVRHISHNLIPEELNFGLFPALESLCEKINNSKKTQVILSVPENVKHYVFEKQNELSIYRIVQEVLNNMVKHAEASLININILQKERQLLIQIKDDGKGFNTENINASKGIGWKNIQARVKMLNGKLEITSEKLTGTEIEISIPEWNKQITK